MMNSEKPLSPAENSSEENDEEEAQEDGTKRSYECTFCKRGFTNAQALGGHMNIHRKDRAKAKQFTLDNTCSSSVNKFNTLDDSMPNIPFVSEILNQPTTRPNYTTTLLESHQRSHPPHGFYCEFYNSRSRPLSLNQELRGANLSLQIGPSTHVGDNTSRRGNQKDSEVDLELRLGHDPY